MKESDFDLVTAYLLEELSPEERTQFEGRLEGEPELKAACREVEATMVGFARMSAKEATTTVQLWERIEATTGGSEETERPQVIEEEKKVVRIGGYLWPIAAALLIGLNLFQYWEQQNLNERWRALENAYERKQALVFERDEALDLLWAERNELREALNQFSKNALASKLSSKYEVSLNE